MKAIIFDCFGVLTTDGWLPFAEKYFGHDESLLQAAHDLNKKSDSRIMSYDEFVEEVASMAHVTSAAARVEIENNIANKPLFAYLKTLKPHYKIGMLSNVGRNWLEELFAPEEVALFDEVVLSCEVGTVKPDPKMYELICEKLEVEPSEAVFIDDIERYVTGATDLGMKGIVYKDYDSFKSQLDAILS